MTAALKTVPAAGATLWKQPKKKNVQINPATLKIDKETVFDPAMLRPRKAGKYDKLLNKLKPGQSIICKNSERNAVGQAIKNWAMAKKMVATIAEVANFQGTEEARVFLLELKPEIKAEDVKVRPLLVSGDKVAEVQP